MEDLTSDSDGTLEVADGEAIPAAEDALNLSQVLRISVPSSFTKTLAQEAVKSLRLGDLKDLVSVQSQIAKQLGKLAGPAYPFGTLDYAGFAVTAGAAGDLSSAVRAALGRIDPEIIAELTGTAKIAALRSSALSSALSTWAISEDTKARLATISTSFVPLTSYEDFLSTLPEELEPAQAKQVLEVGAAVGNALVTEVIASDPQTAGFLSAPFQQLAEAVEPSRESELRDRLKQRLAAFDERLPEIIDGASTHGPDQAPSRLGNHGGTVR